MRFHPTSYLLGALVLAACGSESGKVTLKVSSASSSGALTAAPTSSGGMSLSDGQRALVIDSAELVLREIELDAVEGTVECAEDGEEESDDCGEIESGPVLVALALDGSASTEISVEVAAGSYEEIEFEMHEPEDDARDFLEAHPDFEEITVRVIGSFDGVPFTYSTDVDDEKEIELDSPLEVSADATVALALSVDVSTWFADGAGMLIDPSSANDGGANEGLVKENIKASFDSHEEDDDEEDDSED